MPNSDGFYMIVGGSPVERRRDETLVTSMNRILDEKLAESKQTMTRTATKADRLRRGTRSDSYPMLEAALSKRPTVSPEGREKVDQALGELHRDVRR